MRERDGSCENRSSSGYGKMSFLTTLSPCCSGKNHQRYTVEYPTNEYCDSVGVVGVIFS